MGHTRLVVEDDPFLRLLGVVLDPSTSAERRLAYADFFAHDLPDFDGWLLQLRQRLPQLMPATVDLVNSTDALRAALPGTDFAVVEALPFGAAELAAAPRLRAVQKYGAITGNIDSPACAARGVAVLTLRRRANIACAEHTFALMLGLSRRLQRVTNRISTASLQSAGFAPRNYDRRHTANSNWARIPGISLLHGTTLGIVGMGEIGREVALRGAAFGMNILYHQRSSLPPAVETAHHAHYADLDTLLETSDWVVICLPGNANTHHLFNAMRLARMKPGARLINISRAEIVERSALLTALRSGQLGGFALDPLYEAPGRDEDELLKFENVLLTPHIAAQPRFNALDDIADLLAGLEEKL
ncbi:MAG: NAD(P)-dependent oxidoreductase [Burkholderiales bacterium]|nr:NAD(P)-dependent oxidoreductase [Burkholderiales bacterium]